MDFETILMATLVAVSTVGCVFFIRKDVKQYGLLFAISMISANTLCYMFTFSGFYTYPNNVLHGNLLIPYGLASALFPFIVMFGVRYSPKQWVWKIPFYWGVVHLAVLGEVILKGTSIFKFEPEWDLWDSYTLWWIFYLLFELLGGKIVSPHQRKPIQAEAFRYGRWAWIVLHVIVIVTIFLAGIYVGLTVFA